MKTRIITIACTIFCIAGFSACSDKTVELTGITVSPTFLSLELGDTPGSQQITVTTQPENATDVTYIWSSDNKDVATVSQTGLVTAIGVGSTQIMVMANNIIKKIPVKVVSRSKVIAHRGYWNRTGSAQNSIHSLQGSIELGVYGSECDVWITADDVLVINHDASFNGVVIETSNYAALQNLQLSNGEPIPHLQQFIDIIKTQDKTKNQTPFDHCKRKQSGCSRCKNG